jgi:hypothetical protein
MFNNDINNENILNKEIDITLEEYKTLREEIIENTKTRLQLITLGFTVIVAIFGIGLDSLTSNKSLPQIDDFFLFCILIPLACFSVLFLWENSMHKTLLIGEYIAKEIEPKIASLLIYIHQKKNYFNRHHIIFPICWENYMRTKTVGLSKQWSLLLTFGGIAFISWLIGTIIFLNTNNLLLLSIDFLILLIFVVIVLSLISKLQGLYNFRDQSDKSQKTLEKKDSREKDSREKDFYKKKNCLLLEETKNWLDKLEKLEETKEWSDKLKELEDKIRNLSTEKILLETK